MTEGFSYGANTIRDGVSLTPRRELRALALASEIMRLENLHGYLRFPGPLPVATIRLRYAARPPARPPRPGSCRGRGRRSAKRPRWALPDRVSMRLDRIPCIRRARSNCCRHRTGRQQRRAPGRARLRYADGAVGASKEAPRGEEITCVDLVSQKPDQSLAVDQSVD